MHLFCLCPRMSSLAWFIGRMWPPVRASSLLIFHCILLLWHIVCVESGGRVGRGRGCVCVRARAWKWGVKNAWYVRTTTTRKEAGVSPDPPRVPNPQPGALRDRLHILARILEVCGAISGKNHTGVGRLYEGTVQPFAVEHPAEAQMVCSVVGGTVERVCSRTS